MRCLLALAACATAAVSGCGGGGDKPFQGGARTAELQLTPGTYRMVCTVGDHATLGMTAPLRVRARN